MTQTTLRDSSRLSAKERYGFTTMKKTNMFIIILLMAFFTLFLSLQIKSSHNRVLEGLTAVMKAQLITIEKVDQNRFIYKITPKIENNSGISRFYFPEPMTIGPGPGKSIGGSK